MKAVTTPLASRLPSLVESAKFDFHGDALGEMWDDFQARHTEPGTKCWGDEDVMKKHNLTDPFPETTKHINNMIAEKEKAGNHSAKRNSAKGILYCELMGTPQTVAGVETSDVQYRFFEDRLYLINASIRRLQSGGFSNGVLAYDAIKEAYIGRYGKPLNTHPDVYQNGFGATFKGETVRWIDPRRMYELVVIDGHQEWVAVQFCDMQTQARQKKLASPSNPDDL